MVNVSRVFLKNRVHNMLFSCVRFITPESAVETNENQT